MHFVKITIGKNKTFTMRRAILIEHKIILFNLLQFQSADMYEK